MQATKGNNGYYLISDGGIHAYRTRIRTPSFPHMGIVPGVQPGADGARLVGYFGQH